MVLKALATFCLASPSASFKTSSILGSILLATSLTEELAVTPKLANSFFN